MDCPAYLRDLNAGQRAAAEYGVSDVAGAQISGPLLVIEGAGTGKTSTLAHRVTHLIVTGTPPERILLLTFTRRAAAEVTNGRSDQHSVAGFVKGNIPNLSAPTRCMPRERCSCTPLVEPGGTGMSMWSSGSHVTCMGLYLSSDFFWFADSSLFGAGKAVLHPVACDAVPKPAPSRQGPIVRIHLPPAKSPMRT
jgi:hypothetical protein